MVDKLRENDSPYYDRFRLIPQNESRIWACALNAFSVAAGINSKELELVVGHDGGAVIDDRIDGAQRFAGYSDTELVLALWKKSYLVVTFYVDDISLNERILLRNSLDGQRVVIYYNHPKVGLHAVAWYGTYVSDLRREIVNVTDIPVASIEAFYLVKGQ